MCDPHLIQLVHAISTVLEYLLHVAFKINVNLSKGKGPSKQLAYFNLISQGQVKITFAIMQKVETIYGNEYN